MPREQITYNQIIESHTGPTIDGIPSATVNRELPRRNLHILWNRTGGSGALGTQRDIGWVQIGIDVTIEELRGMLAAAEDEAAAEARKLESAGDLDLDQWQFRIMSDVLDRSETNDAIRVLRRARNTAYGADE